MPIGNRGVIGEAGIQDVTLDLEITPELAQEGLMREVVRNVQEAHKDAGLEVDDRINLRLESADDSITTVLKNEQLTDVIMQETLANSINHNDVKNYTTTAKIDGAELTIAFDKA